MSQNAHHLLLFFGQQSAHEACVRAVLELSRDEPERSAPWQKQLGIDLTGVWNDSWFNQRYKAQPEFVQLDYDTSTSAPLPLQLLAQLFQGGLRAAVIEVFYDQVGEVRRMHFVDGKLVDREHFYRQEPEAGRVVDAQLGKPDDPGSTFEPVAKAKTLQQLLKEEKEELKQREEVTNAIIELAKASRESGVNPLELAQSALVLAGLGKGLLHAFVFTLVTVLLFKGFWLWIGLGVVLAVVLPLYYATQANKPFRDDDSDDGADSDANDVAEQEQAPC